MRPRLPTVLCAALLAACGGGGDSGIQGIGGNASGPAFQPAPGVDFNAFAAWQNFLATSRTWTVTGTGSDGNRYTVTIATAAAAPATFTPTEVVTSVSDATLRIEGAGISSTVVRSTFFDPAGFQPIGLAWQGEGPVPTCDVAVEAGVPPTAAQIPSSGLLARLARRADCARGPSTPTGATLLLTWSLDQEDGINVFCINSDVLDAADPARQQCVEVAPDGTLGTGAFVSLELDNGVTVEAASR